MPALWRTGRRRVFELRIRRLAKFLSIAGACLVVSHASAEPQGRMREIAAMAPPAGFVSFCMREPAQCRDGRRRLLHFDDRLLHTLSRVNDDVNKSTEWVDDETHYGRKEYFAIISDGKGDCDDMVVTKRAMLHDKGLPLHDLRIAIALTPKGERHAVLVVTTDRGDYVLDSIDPAIRRFDEVRYAWIERQNGSAMGWAKVEQPSGTRMPLVASSDDDTQPLASNSE